MPNVEVRGRYRAFTYDGTTSLDFTTFSNNVSVIRRPNEISFVTLRQYIPGISTPFTIFEPGSAYVVVSRDGNANFDMGPYTRVDRLPSSLNVKSPQYYLGLDKNSITIPLSVYALSVNRPLSSVTGITYVNGAGISQSTVTVDQIRSGFQTSFTHFLPNSGYQLRNRTAYTFFAPLQSEMGDSWIFGNNEKGQYGMGHQYSLSSTNYRQSVPDSPFLAERMFGNWVKIVENAGSVLALSACGTKNKLFVCGRNDFGQLGLGYTSPLSAPITVFKNVPGDYSDICTGLHSMVVNEFGELYVCGYNEYGQLGLGNTDPIYTFTRNFNFISGSNQVEINTSSICTGGYHSLVRDVNGTLWTCGRNDYGQLGVGTVGGIRATFTSVGNIGVGDIGASTNASMYVSNGRMYACGYNYYNSSSPQSSSSFRIGVSNAESTSNVSTFTQEICAFNDITNLWVGGRGIFVKRSSQSVLWACGINVWGGLGMAVYSTVINGHRKYIDIRALQPTVIPSDTFHKFFPAVFIAFSTSARSNLYWIDNSTFELKTLVLADSYLSSTSYFVPYEKNLQIICSSLNGNANSSWLTSVLIHNRSSIPSPTPVPKYIFPSANPPSTIDTGEIVFNASSSEKSQSVWYSDIAFSEAKPCNYRNPITNNYTPYNFNRFRLYTIIFPDYYSTLLHYNYRDNVAPGIEPKNRGGSGRKCYIFLGRESRTGALYDRRCLAFQYYSQNLDMATLITDVNPGGLTPCDYGFGGSTAIVSKMAPNSGSFNDSTNSLQRLLIDNNSSTDPANGCGSKSSSDFIISEYDNTYHVIYYKNIPETYDKSRYYPFYVKSTDRGNTWSVPLNLFISNFYDNLPIPFGEYTSDRYPSPGENGGSRFFGSNTINVYGGPAIANIRKTPYTTGIGTTPGTSNTFNISYDNTVATMHMQRSYNGTVYGYYTSQQYFYDLYLTVKFPDGQNTYTDKKQILLTRSTNIIGGIPKGLSAIPDYVRALDYTNPQCKVLFDKANTIICLWSGWEPYAGPVYYPWPADPTIPYLVPYPKTYNGPGPMLVYFKTVRYHKSDNQWYESPLFNYNSPYQYPTYTSPNSYPICRTFPRSMDIGSSGVGSRAYARAWDACIDESDNKLCVAYCPDVVTPNLYLSQWSALTIRVKKIEQYMDSSSVATLQRTQENTYFDEQVYDISSLPDSQFTGKSINGITLYYDTQINKIVVIFQVYSRNGVETIKMQRNGTNSWSQISNNGEGWVGPSSGGTDIVRVQKNYKP